MDICKNRLYCKWLTGICNDDCSDFATQSLRDELLTFISEWTSLQKKAPSACHICKFLTTLQIAPKHPERCTIWACRIVAVCVILGFCIDMSLYFAVYILLSNPVTQLWEKHTERERSVTHGFDIQYVDVQHPLGELLLSAYGRQDSINYTISDLTLYHTKVMKPTQLIFHQALKKYGMSNSDIVVNLFGLTVYIVHSNLWKLIQYHNRSLYAHINDEPLWRVYERAISTIQVGRKDLCFPFNRATTKGMFCRASHAAAVPLPEITNSDVSEAIDTLVHEITHAILTTIDRAESSNTELLATREHYVRLYKNWDHLLGDLLDGIHSVGHFQRTATGVLTYIDEVATEYWMSSNESRVHLFLLMLVVDGIMDWQTLQNVGRDLFILYWNCDRSRLILQSLFDVLREYFAVTQSLPVLGKPADRVGATLLM